MARASSTLTPATPDLNEPIVALASAPGPGPRAILRLTAPRLRVVLEALTPILVKEPEGRSLVIETSVSLPALTQQVPIQLLFWPAPRSATGQDVAELHVLASLPLVQALRERLLALGCRLARPGEFTLRAYLAGKLNLVQAAAVHDLVRADSPEARRSAFDRLAGDSATPLFNLREELLLVLAEIEAGLDFPEEDLSLLSTKEVVRRCDSLKVELSRLAREFVEPSAFERGPRVVLAGWPNAGKSSLFNALLGRSQALVAAQAGTTRDWLVAELEISGMRCQLIDTAGWQADSQNAIEALAQQQRAQMLEEADIVLLCQAADENLRPMCEVPAGPIIVGVETKADLRQCDITAEGGLAVSVKSGVGLRQLLVRLAELLRQRRPAGGTLGALASQFLQQAADRIEAAAELLARAAYPEMVALELRLAVDALGTLCGTAYTEDLLDRVFGQFCIGK